MRRTSRMLLALVLVFSMLSTCGGFAALADQTEAAEAVTTSPADEESVKVDDNVSVSSPMYEAGALADANAGGSAEVTVNGSVSTSLPMPAVKAAADNQGSASVTVTGDATTDSFGSSPGIEVVASGTGSSVEVNIGTESSGGNVEATAGNMAAGMNVDVEAGASAEIHVEDTVTAAATGGGGGNGVILGVNGAESTATVEIGGDLSASSQEGSAMGIIVNTSGDGSSAALTVGSEGEGGTVEVNAGAFAYGVMADSMGGSTASVEIADALSVETTGDSQQAVGVSVVAFDSESKAEVTVDESLTVSGGRETKGIYVESLGTADNAVKVEAGELTVTGNGDAGALGVQTTVYEGGQSDVQISGGISVSGDKGATGITTGVAGMNFGGENDITVGESVEVTTGDTGVAKGIELVQNDDTTTVVSVGGDVMTNGGQEAKGVFITANEGADLTVTVGGDVKVEDADQSVGISTETVSDGKTTVTVDGAAELKNASDAIGVSATAKGDSETTITIGESIEVTDVKDGTGVSIQTNDQGDVTVSVDGDVNAETNGHGTGVRVDGSGGKSDVEIGGALTVTGVEYSIGAAILVNSDSETDVNVEGPITVTDMEYHRAAGIQVTAHDEATATVTTGSDVTVHGGQEAQCIFINGNEHSESTVTVGGDIKVENAIKSVGVSAQTAEDGKATVTVDGAAEVKDSSDAIGVSVNALGDSETTVTIGENIEVTDVGDGTGVWTQTSKNGEATVNVGGEVNVETNGKAQGVRVNGSGGKSDVEIGGALTVTGVEYAFGVEVRLNSDSEAEVNVGGPITVTDEEYWMASGIIVSVAEGKATVTVGEKDSDVDGEDKTLLKSDGEGISVSGIKAGEANISIYGDVEAGESALKVINYDNSEVISDILVDGTLTAGTKNGNKTAVLINENTTEDNLKLTVWKVELDEENTIVKDAGMNGQGEQKTTANTEAVEKSIMYIIRLEQPDEGATLTAVKKDGSDLDQSHEYGVANEGEEVYMKIALQDGFKVKGAFSDEGKTIELLYDEENGDYYVVVPKGGGVYLSVELERIAVPGPDSSSTDYGYTYLTPNSSIAYADVTFSLNGGHTLKGHTEDIVKTVPVGTWLLLIQAPVKEGTTFVRWEADLESVKVCDPGVAFCVTENTTFTAVWADEEAEQAEPTSMTDAATVTNDETTTDDQEAAIETEEEASAVQETAEELVAPVEEPAAETDDALTEETETIQTPDEGDAEAEVSDEPETKEEEAEVTVSDTPDEEAEEAEVSGTVEAEAVNEETEEPSVISEGEDTEAEPTAATLDLSSLIEAGADPLSLEELNELDGDTCQAKLNIDLGNGKTIEIPVNIQLSLGEATEVNS